MRVSFCTPRLVDSLVALQCQSHGRSSQIPANCIAVSTRSSDRPSPFVKNAKVTSRGCRQRERAKFRHEIGTIDVLTARPATRENIELQLEGEGRALTSDTDLQEAEGSNTLCVWQLFKVWDILRARSLRITTTPENCYLCNGIIHLGCMCSCNGLAILAGRKFLCGTAAST